MKFTTFIIILCFASTAFAAPPSEKSKFYDFGDQLVNGRILKPQTLYINKRRRADFERLLKLKKSFLPRLFKTHKEKVFK